MDKSFFRQKCVMIMGLGRFGGGVDSTIFACQCGARVIVTDEADEKKLEQSIKQLTEYKDIEYHLGGHREEDFGAESDVDIIIVNPAVNPENEFLRAARAAVKTITSQIEIFFQLCPAKTIGITGSNGKSTTTSLTAHLLRAGTNQGYKDVYLSGNIGNEPLLGLLDKMTASDVVVLELSSFQLEQLAHIEKSPDIAVITNLTPNHLDRHNSFEAYCDAKENIFRFQKCNNRKPAVSIFNAEDAVTAGWFARYKQDANRKCIKFWVEDVPAELVEKFALPGRVNLSNLAAALSSARCFGITDEKVAETLGDFKGLADRLELVGVINGVSWYNDSISTTPVSTMAAIDSFDEPKVLIAGGYDKKLGFGELGKKIATDVKAAILLGQTSEAIKQAIMDAGGGEIRIETADSMAGAAAVANSIAQVGDVVLLSPACASYDMFNDYRERAFVFRQEVEKLRDRL